MDDTWAVILPSMGGEFHRIDSLDWLYNRDMVIGYGLTKDTSWILYRRLQNLGMDTILDMSFGDLRKVVMEIKNMDYVDAYNLVKWIKKQDNKSN